MNNAPLKEHLSQIFLTNAELIEYQQQDGSLSKCILMRIPYRSLGPFQKVNEKVIEHLEKKFNWPVIVVANRTIISKRGSIFPLLCSQAPQEPEAPPQQNPEGSSRGHLE